MAHLRVNNNQKKLSAHGTRRMCCVSITLMYTREIRRIRYFVTCCVSARKYGATWLDPLRENWIYRENKNETHFLKSNRKWRQLNYKCQNSSLSSSYIVTPFLSTSRANWERFSRDFVFFGEKKEKKNEMARQVGKNIWIFCLLLFFLASC